MNIKRTAYLLVVVLTFSLLSCNNKAGSNIVGTWDAQEVQFTKLDQLAQFFYDSQMYNYKSQLSVYKSQLDSLSEEDQKAYLEIIEEYERQIESLSVDTIKSEIVKSSKPGGFIFKNDSTFVLVNGKDSLNGNWGLNAEANVLEITVADQKEKIEFKIVESTDKELKLLQENKIDTIVFDITYSFTKGTQN